MKRPTTLPIGSVSHATMRPEDLIPAFVDAADGLRLSRADRSTVRQIAKRAEADEDSEYWGEEADEDLTELFELLDRYTPDYCYFGASEGDGADYGVWPVSELFNDYHEGGYDGSIGRVNDTSELRTVDRKYSHALHVNDHGNCTLYRRAGRRWVECWAIV